MAEYECLDKMHLPLNLCLALIMLLLATVSSTAQTTGVFDRNESPLPKPNGPVMDYAGVLDPLAKSRIERKIRAFSKSTNPTVELAVAIVRTTDGIPIFDYSLAVARGWGIGTRAEDNPGALLFIAVDDRRYFTQVSRDLEDELPDGLVGSLQRKYLVPQFKRQNYARGIEDTIDSYITTIEQRKSGAPPTTKTSPVTDDSEPVSDFECVCGLAICGLVVVLILFAFFSGSRNKSKPNKKDKDRWGGGGFGGSGGGINGGEIAVDILGAVLTGLASGGSSSGGSSSSWGGSSGSDWGGFGGGGDFGGGGAGGGW